MQGKAISTIGDYLKDLRLARGVSIRQLARSAQLSPSTLSRWEAGHSRPSIHELDALMGALNATERERRRALELMDAPRAIARLREMASFSEMPPMPVAGDLLRAMRLRQGWTLDRTAAAMRISSATLSRWERAETWPSPADLHRLCYVLNAHDEELVALSCGRQLLRYDQKPFPSALPALKGMLEDLEQDALQVEAALRDLFYLSLEAHLWHLLQQGKPVLALLITTYVRHARVLLNEARLIEAQTPAYRALQLMNRCERLDPPWLGAIHIIAKGAAEGGRKFRPLQGVEVLRDWLPVAMRLSLTYEAWFRRDIAEYVSQTRSRAEATEASRYAMQIGLGIGEDKNVFLSHALVLLNVGRPSEALELLVSTPLLACNEEQALLQRVHESAIWARALHEAGREVEAMQWMERVHQLRRQHNLWQISTQLDEFSRLLGLYTSKEIFSDTPIPECSDFP